MKFIEPLYDRVVLILMPEETSKGGIILGDVQKNESARAKVVALGPGKYDLSHREYLPPPISVGDIVVVNPRLGTRIKLEVGGELYIIQSTDEIVGKEIEKDSK